MNKISKKSHIKPRKDVVHLHGRLPTKLLNLLQRLLAIHHTKRGQNGQRTRDTVLVIHDVVFLIDFEKCAVEGLALAEEVHALDAVADGGYGVRGECPGEDGGVEGFGARDVADGDLEPGDLAKGFLDLKREVSGWMGRVGEDGGWTGHTRLRESSD